MASAECLARHYRLVSPPPHHTAVRSYRPHGVLTPNPDKPGDFPNDVLDIPGGFVDNVSCCYLCLLANPLSQRSGDLRVTIKYPTTSSRRLADYYTCPHDFPPSHQRGNLRHHLASVSCCFSHALRHWSPHQVNTDSRLYREPENRHLGPSLDLALPFVVKATVRLPPRLTNYGPTQIVPRSATSQVPPQLRVVIILLRR